MQAILNKKTPFYPPGPPIRGGIAEPTLIPGPEMGTTLGPWGSPGQGMSSLWPTPAQ